MALNLVRRIVQNQSIRQFSHETWVSGPPRVRISAAEKAVHSVLISCGVLAGPMWIMANLQEYKKRDD
uniref:Cytochrome c oxidase polypeptide n=1 Tax=Acartia pacifica TaxID=335913 RepID=A0A0U2UMT6_ACAPC|nr:cytochrome c oxidase polypeptide [Acartia pacifica]